MNKSFFLRIGTRTTTRKKSDTKSSASALKTVLLLILLSLVCIPLNVIAQESAVPSGNLTPVPPAWLNNNRLSITKYDCSIETPDNNWKWFIMAREADKIILMCHNNVTDEHFPVVIGAAASGSSQDMDQFSRGFIYGLKDSVKQQGVEISNTLIAESEIPIKGFSRKITMDFKYPNGIKAKSINYVGCAKDAFVFNMMLKPDEKENPILAKIAGSLSLGQTQNIVNNKSNKARTQPNYAYMGMAFNMILGFIIIGLCSLINLIIKRRLINGALVGFIILIILFIAKIVLTTSLCIKYDIEAEKSGELIGTDFVMFVGPIAALFILARRFSKKYSSKESLVKPEENKL